MRYKSKLCEHSRLRHGYFCYCIYGYINFTCVPLKYFNEIYGASYSFDLLVEKDEWLSEIGADKNELLDKVRNITLEMKWDGGEETVLIVCDELQKDQ